MIDIWSDSSHNSSVTRWWQ